MKLPFINESIFKPYKNSVERRKSSCIYTHTCVCYFKFVNFIYFGFCALSLILLFFFVGFLRLNICEVRILHTNV